MKKQRKHENLTILDHPDMGLNNKICTDKKYFCAKHEVWLSTEDVTSRKCLNRLSADMRNIYKCTSIRNTNHEII